MPAPLKVLFLAAEAAPLVKVGGLADFAGSLPMEIRRLGHEIIRVLPLHPSLRPLVKGVTPAVLPAVPTRGSLMQAEAYLLESESVPLYLLDGPPLRAADAVYHAESGRDALKYVFFSLAALELARSLGWAPDIVHTNDWHTAAANLWLAGRGRKDRFFARTRSVLSIHNLPYFGLNAGWALAQFGLGVPRPGAAAPPEPGAAGSFTEEDRYAALPYWALSALLPLGIAAADRMIAVSPTYAEEILTAEFGAGLEDYLRTQSERLSGILNGLDLERWNPATDANLVSRFDSSSLSGRLANKQALMETFGLRGGSGVPLIGMVTRLTEQKGIDLALAALETWCAHGNQAVILGSGEPWLEQRCRMFAARHEGLAGLHIGYDDPLGDRIYAGSDFFLIPSRYEPCGISQMIAMRFGSLPVARAVGGLRDTITDLSRPDGCGILFSEAAAEGVAFALGRAEELFRQKDRFGACQTAAMRRDFSWTASARAYEREYRSLAGG